MIGNEEYPDPIVISERINEGCCIYCGRKSYASVVIGHVHGHPWLACSRTCKEDQKIAEEKAEL